ncbi:nucleoside triphosphate pyrophosphohydrolase [Hyphococcus luteus]|uniref:Nucleoside triphosphate pyrophosphohydrolase n=1 Tax=Hyphococcus luteus TaxID=2058213 RepID=A0A2S7K2F8_9PROT|nr:nucleoside triphosphate pyrophosphohydrolase [Marinicaulis flavus]PQA86684.1 nucleoside triphosphate pyrophosphohydrolase [Marinicaulis flavus]
MTDEVSSQNPSEDARKIDALLEVMARLRSPEGGCPWDLEQNFRTIAPYTVEEAYEVADAIERGDMAGLKEELGDLLFQSVFHAQMAKEEGLFTFGDVAEAIAEKMIRRHPHVFGEDDMRSSEEQTAAWEVQKAEERKAKGKDGLLDDVPAGLPGLTRAVKLQKRAGRVGFDWSDARSVLDKIAEETEELTEAMANADKDHIEEEFGDLLFVLANLSRHLDIDPESALRRANEKFIRRFKHIEKTFSARGESLADASLDDMEAVWNEAKALDKTAKDRA